MPLLRRLLQQPHNPADFAICDNPACPSRGISLTHRVELPFRDTRRWVVAYYCPACDTFCVPCMDELDRRFPR